MTAASATPTVGDRSVPAGLLTAATAAAGLLAATATVVGSQLLKASLERPDLLSDGAANSFPSGHVAAVAGVAAALLIAVPARLRGAVGWLVAAPVVVVTGTATVALEWHRPSDVLGSVLLAVALGALGAAVSGRSEGRSWS